MLAARRGVVRARQADAHAAEALAVAPDVHTAAALMNLELQELVG